MPRYYFHIHTHDDQLIEDEEGLEFPTVLAAFAEAMISAHDMAADAARTGRRPDKRIEVTNEAGEVLRTVAVLTVIN